MPMKILLLLLLCTGCHSAKKEPPFAVQTFNGRDEIISYGQKVRRPVYQAKVPLAWKRIDPAAKESILDTTKPIVSFFLEEGLLLTIHTFPTHSLEERIPPIAQVERWAAQLKGGKSHTEPVGWGGFAGIRFEGEIGERGVVAWSLQLDLEHYQALHFLASTVEEEEHYKQMAADYTIKVTGPKALIEQHREELSFFVDSFELIQEIPKLM
jgi:hypothetical protein